jgi:hypothetical protein
MNSLRKDLAAVAVIMSLCLVEMAMGCGWSCLPCEDPDPIIPYRCNPRCAYGDQCCTSGNPEGSCCDHICGMCSTIGCVEKCSDPTQECCNGECYDVRTHKCCIYGGSAYKCGINDICCYGNCCHYSCCNSWDCKYCDGSCKSCLRKVGNYEEFGACQRVPDPIEWPEPDGCTNPIGSHPDDPANCSPPDNSSFLQACNLHDICYQTCGISKGVCDSYFGDDMNNACEGNSPLCYIVCEAQRTIYWAAVSICGETAYETDQLRVCACCDCE